MQQRSQTMRSEIKCDFQSIKGERRCDDKDGFKVTIKRNNWSRTQGRLKKNVSTKMSKNREEIVSSCFLRISPIFLSLEV